MNHRWKGCIQAACLAATLCSGEALAGPQDGFGAYAGAAGATEGGMRSKGISLGMDAQFAINDDWSLVPYLMVSRETDSASHIVSDGLAGLQLRRWFGAWFLGVHGFVHDRIIMGSGTVGSSAYGPAGGVLAGLEMTNGWGAEIQTDAFEGSNSPGVRRNAVRAHLTYRWR